MSGAWENEHLTDPEPYRFSFSVNPYHVQNKPNKWFEVYKFFKLFR